MTSAYVLILAVLVLGGLLATLGDRLGTKVGKARLSLFGLRPRQTATVVTIVTGLMIAASTLSILFATSKSLRVGVFQLDEKLKELREAQKELVAVITQKQQVEAQLNQAREQQVVAQQQLNEIDRSLQGALQKQALTQAQLNQTQGELNKTQNQLSGIQTDYQKATSELSLIEGKFARAQSQLEEVSQQAQKLRDDIVTLQLERRELIEQGEQVRATIAQRDRELAVKQAEIEQQRQEAAQQRQLLTEQKSQLDEQIRQLAQQQQQIAVQEGDIAEQQEQMAQQAAEIAQQKQAIAVQEEELGKQEQEIASQEMEIAQQKQAITLQEEEIAQRDRQISDQEAAITEQRSLLKQLATQQAFLQGEVQSLERDFQLLREGTVAIRRNQVLASGVLRVIRPETAPEATQQLLTEANLAAIALIRPGTTQLNEWAIAITETELEQLIGQIDDGQDYVVRILSAANYLLGERQVNVFADAVPNEVVFKEGELVATTSVRPSQMSEDQIKEQLNLLLAAANFRARRSGILTDAIQVGDGRLAALMEFIKQLPDNNEPGVIQAVSAGQTYTSGPLTLEFTVLHEGKIVFRTD
ncbi:DUF3084 domain-containing protein [Laspinema olomoucense]|uniref:DUF3084 domain-containing protein n=1 Tax=Laspinema olomoucense TaxID=3231600 RepID=UPI0021BB4BC3|nr:DUF3084 domain-containing protein [Laspinema sp. D3a]MCT7991982.1 DUF3084 domain-containing protein [Laspinema sp. D3a]